MESFGGARAAEEALEELRNFHFNRRIGRRRFRSVIDHDASLLLARRYVDTWRRSSTRFRRITKEDGQRSKYSENYKAAAEVFLICRSCPLAKSAEIPSFHERCRWGDCNETCFLSAHHAHSSIGRKYRLCSNIFWISASLRPPDACIRMLCSLPLALSLAQALTMPLAIIAMRGQRHV